MKQSRFDLSKILRAVLAAGVLVAVAGAIVPARADDDHHDQRWREHQRHEEEFRAHHRGHWDHGYWDRDDEVEVYRPPAVYYAPPPPSGLDFVFRFGR